MNRDELSALLGIKELTLSSGTMSEDQESILILGDKPEGLENQDIYLRYAKERTDIPEAFYADVGVFNSSQKYPDSEFARNGWSFNTYLDPDGNKTTKRYYVHIKNERTNKEYMGIPVTKNHFHPGFDPVIDNLLIVDRQSFLDNPNISLSLNHRKIKVEAVDGKWVVANNDPLADRIRLPGNTVEVNNPEQIYLLTEAELSQYNSKGKRKGWSEDKEKNEYGLRSFVKREFGNGNIDPIDRRYVKEIMIPLEVDGEKTPVKHYLLSDAKTLQGIEIMEPTLKNEKSESVSDEIADDTVAHPEATKEEVLRMSESKHFFKDNVVAEDAPVNQGDPVGQRYPGEDDLHNMSEPEYMSGFEYMDEPAKVNEPVKAGTPAKPKPKVPLTGMILEIAQQISAQNKGTLSVAEKTFLDELNAIQDDPIKLKAALNSVQNDPSLENVINVFKERYNKGEIVTPDPKDGVTQSTSDKAKTTASGGEAAFGAAAGAVAGLVKGAFGAVQTVAGGTLNAVNKIIENHHNRKQYRLENPEVVERELAASKEKLMIVRRARAEDSNNILDAKIESVLSSKRFIEQHPGVQQMFNMIEANPTMKDQLNGWLESTATENTVFAEHLNNVKKNAGSVARAMDENLVLNSLAGADLGERKTKFELFNEKFTNDTLSDVLPDTDVEVPAGEQAVTIKESITLAINNIMKMLKEMMLRLTGKNKQGESAAGSLEQDEAPAMSR